MDVQGWNYLIGMAATVAFAVTAVNLPVENQRPFYRRLFH